MSEFDPFANEEDALSVEGLNFENRTSLVSIYGSIDITSDKRGLNNARRLAALLGSIVARLETAELADEIPPDSGMKTVKNPFS